MILLVVLWLVAMMTVLVVALNAYARNNVAMASIEADRLRAQMVLASGVDAAVGMILAVPDKQRSLFWGNPAAVDLGGGATVAIAITDASGFVDINRADNDLLKGLAQNVDVAPEAAAVITDAIGKWRDSVKPPDQQQAAGQPAGAQLQNSNGQNDGQQGNTGDQGGATANQTDQGQPEGTPPEQAGPGAFFSVAQLYSIPGVAARDIDKFLPFIGLYSKDGKVNPMAAPQTVLQSVPGMTAQQIAAIQSARQASRPDDPAVAQIVNQLKKFLAISEPKSFVIDVRGVAGPNVVPGSRLRAVVALDPSGTPLYRVLNWSW